MSNIHANFKKKNKIVKLQTLFSARFDKQFEDDQVIDEIEIIINLMIKQSLADSDIQKIDVRSHLEQQIQNQESKVSGWRFRKNNSMTICFYKATELN